MHEFTKVEKSILKKYISDPKLFTSLALIRAVMETIWASDAPRIVQDYTDHGIAHSERIIVFIEKLLRITPSAKFSQQEIYLLLAGIYLHDIGMQCDIAKYPEIKEKAEILGAKFGETFTSITTSGYSLNEQKEIRKNHHFLSAAWIDYLYEKNDPILSEAIKRIPDDLIDDLIDVCKFHSGLPINHCSDSFIHNPNGRKKLIAALLRFADELDISNTRVNLETAKIFNLKPENSVYWWIHNRTNLIFTDSNKISLKARLHPKDFELHSAFIHNYISNFKIKNQPILDILVEYRIPIVISNNSEIISDKRVKEFPPEINAILDKMAQNTEVQNSYKSDLPKTFTDASNKKFEDSNLNALVKSENRILIDNKSDFVTHKSVEKFPPERTSISDKNIQNIKVYDASGKSDLPKTFNSSFTGMEFVLIPAGKFMMGSAQKNRAFKFIRDIFRSDEFPLHEVTINSQYYLGKFPVTQKQWKDVMGNIPCTFKGDDYPIEKISWYDAQTFIEKLNEMEGTNEYRLPSEAEWEYACRSGTETLYCFGDDKSKLKEYAWNSNGLIAEIHPVGQKKPNHWGLYDMHGNVWELVQDNWHNNYSNAPTDGSAWEDETNPNRIRRGGCWSDFDWFCRSAIRLSTDPNEEKFGFRYVDNCNLIHCLLSTISNKSLVLYGFLN